SHERQFAKLRLDLRLCYAMTVVCRNKSQPPWLGSKERMKTPTPMRVTSRQSAPPLSSTSNEMFRETLRIGSGRRRSRSPGPGSSLPFSRYEYGWAHLAQAFPRVH